MVKRLDSTMRLIILLIGYCHVIEVSIAAPCTTGYEECKLITTTLPKLCCRISCCKTFPECDKKENNQRFSCNCNAIPQWNENLLYSLDVEYISLLGEAILVGEVSRPSLIQHKNGYLSALPINLCEYPNLTIIDLSSNYITDIGDIHCLRSLDSLKLGWNKISYISNKTFRGLLSLRILNLEYNKISHIEPYSFSDDSFSALRINLIGNQLSKIDITNVITGRPFCRLDYSYNRIKEFVNELEWKLDLDKDYDDSGGMTEFIGNAFTQFVDFEKLGIPDITMLGKLRSFGFDLRGMKLSCDCKMVPFLQLYSDVVSRIWRNYYNVSCYNPISLRNISIPYLVNTSQLDRFICNIFQNKSCPDRDCHCFEQPSRDRIVVNCSGIGLDKMPHFMPTGRQLEIHLNDNQISVLSGRDYLKRTRILNLSNNKITSIDGDAVELFRNINMIDLHGNPDLKEIPNQLRLLKPSKFKFGTLNINCNCSNTWFGDWIRYHRLERGENNSFLCTTHYGVKLPQEVTEDFLNCAQSSMVPIILAVSLGLCALLVAVIASISNSYKYELYLLYRKYTKKNKDLERKFDLYISGDESVEDVKIWIRNDLLPSLETSGYNVCLPERDFRLGVPYEEEIAFCVGQSKNALIILSEKEHEFIWDLEWSHIWHLYTSYKIINIIIINFDNLQKNAVDNRIVKAFIRLGMYRDFADMKKCLISDIKSILGRPGRIHRRLENEHFNRNTKFLRRCKYKVSTGIANIQKY